MIFMAAGDGAEGGTGVTRPVVYVLMDCERHEGGEVKGAYWTAEMAIAEAKKHPNPPNGVSFWKVVEVPFSRPATDHETVWNEILND